tara:strand:- start:604 stop:1551 length:948 start_codon:yes stop_codon:yes gene_type:complete
MATRFILDKQLQHRRKTVAEILSIAKKKPYPTKDATHLASFVKACFEVTKQEKLRALNKKAEIAKLAEWAEQQELKESELQANVKSLESNAPTPGADLPELLPPNGELPLLDLSDLENIPEPQTLSKREYVLRIYDTPIGILVDKDENNKYIYHVVEPSLSLKTIEKAKELYSKDLQRNNALFDDQRFAIRACKKLGLKYSDLTVRKLRYYLERDVLGGGKLDPLFFDEKVKTLISKGPHKKIQVVYEGLGEIESNVTINNNEELNKLMQRIATATGKPLDNSNTILDVIFQGLKFEGVMGLGGTNSKLTVRRIQ